MNKRKIVIPIFILLVTSFILLISFYIYKKHNDRIKLDKEKRINEKIIKEKVALINEKYSIFINKEKINSDDEVSTFLNNIIDINNEINSLKVNDVTINNIINPKKGIEKNNDLYNKIENLNYPNFTSFIKLSK